jgi:type II secretory pathway pseudopilin PulG
MTLMRSDIRWTSVSRRRRGMATLIVLLLISVALAVAYVSMRSQTMTLQVQRNATLRASARDAALTGMAIALKTMQTTSWAGVSTTLSRSLDNGCGFEATYTTGDASLTDKDPDYNEYPYRVTVKVTGYASDAGNGGRRILHQLSAVVRLVPRATAAEPTGWSDITGNTLCQWSQGDFSVNFPFRIEGPVRIRAQLDLSDSDLDWSSNARTDYFSGLHQRHSDMQPFTGLVQLPYSAQKSSGNKDWLITNLGVTTQDRPLTTSISWPNAALPTGYRLYPGGKLYTVPTLPSELRNDTTTWKPSPVDNPLGAFYRSGRVKIYENVTVQGTMFLSGTSEGDLDIYGTGVNLLPADLPALQTMSGSSPIRLPTVFAQDDVIVYSSSNSVVSNPVVLKGLIVAFDELRVQGGPQDNISLLVQGKVTAQDVNIDRRDQWNMSSWLWNIYYTFFKAHQYEPGGERYFPDHMAFVVAPRPNITIQGDPTGTSCTYHWQNPSDPVYVPHMNDMAAGVSLRWELVRWGR